jgi:hypothetical protein
MCGCEYPYGHDQLWHPHDTAGREPLGETEDLKMGIGEWGLQKEEADLARQAWC